MAISSTPIQENGFSLNVSGTVFNKTLSSGPVNGNVLICGFGSSVGQDLVSITQTGVVWTKDATVSGVNKICAVWRGVVGSGASTTVTFTTSIDVSITTARTNVSEWSGTNNAAPSAVTSSNATATTITGASMTPTASANVLLYFVTACGSASGSPSTGFTALTTTNSGVQFAYQVVASASGSYQVTWTSSLSEYVTETAIYGAASGAASNASRYYLRRRKE